MKGDNLQALARAISQLPEGTKYEYSLFDMETKKDWDGVIELRLRVPTKAAANQKVAKLPKISALLSDGSL